MEWKEVGCTCITIAVHVLAELWFHQSRSGLVVKFVLAMHEPRVRFTAATMFWQS
jgi:hypothetical protein